MKWSLPGLLQSVNDDIEQSLTIARESVGHPGNMGDASEAVWLELLKTYLPLRYSALKAHAVDSNGKFSEQMDIVVVDRQYSPYIFHFKGQTVVLAESVYAAFEAKQTLNANQVRYAQKKVASVRRLHRTSVPIPTADGLLKAKQLHPILGGLLTLDSNWKPAFGKALRKALEASSKQGFLDIGCVAARGTFAWQNNAYVFNTQAKPATAFLLELIARLQEFATVPMVDIRAYAKWL